MSGRPRVAVIIPAYNASAFLAETLRSLEAQTFPDWQAVVVDDGSTDATAAIAREAAARDPRIRLVQQSNRGLSASRNRGMAELPGEYFAFLDADDLWEPRKLELQVQVADALGVGLVFCPFRRFGLAKVRRDDWSQRLGYVHGTAWLERLSGGNYINPSCVLLRGELVARYGGFESGLEGAEDWELWLRLAAAGVDCYGVPEVLCRYRMHPNSMSQNLARAFWVQARILPRHLPASWMRAPQVRHSFRVAFRNAFNEYKITCFAGRT